MMVMHAIIKPILTSSITVCSHSDLHEQAAAYLPFCRDGDWLQSSILP